MLNRPLNRNTLLGVANFLFGIGLISYQLWVIFVGAPAQQEVFKSFERPIPNLSVFYTIAVVYIAIGLANLFSGVKLFSDDKSKAYFNRGMITLVISIVAFVLASGIYALLVILPIYDLANSL